MEEDFILKTDDEKTVIEWMDRRAKRYGLCFEVRDAYDAYRRSGDNPFDAAWCALYDWDI